MAFHQNITAVRRLSALAVSIALLWNGAASAAGQLSGFAGSWAGSGFVTMADGARETVHCRAAYTATNGGDALGLNVVCASDSYRMQIISSIAARGRDLSGTWRETSRAVDGDVSGVIAAPNEIQANFSGTGFSIGVTAATHGNQQTIAIAPQGGDIKSVQVALRKH